MGFYWWCAHGRLTLLRYFVFFADVSRPLPPPTAVGASLLLCLSRDACSSSSPSPSSWNTKRTQAHFTDHGGDVMSVSILPSVDKNVFVSGSCDSLAKVTHTCVFFCEFFSSFASPAVTR